MNTSERTLLANLIEGKSLVELTLRHVEHLLDWQLLIETGELQGMYDFQAELFRIWTREALVSERS